MEGLLEFLQRIGSALRSRYVRELESEVARLRAENRALLNSILGTAGIPPLPIAAIAPSAASGAPAKPSAAATPLSPVRRRSWQQIGRMLEIEEARQLAAKNSTSPDFPAPAQPAKSTAKPNGSG